MAVIRRSPITRKVRVKPRRTGKPRRSTREFNPEFLRWIVKMPCWVCFKDIYARLCGAGTEEITQSAMAIYIRQKTPSEPAHLGLSTSRRGLSQKFSDSEVFPLCKCHHRTGEDSIHELNPGPFFAHHGGDRDEVVHLFQRLFRESLQ